MNNSHQDPQKVEDGKGESVSIGVLRVEKFSGLTSKRMRGGVRVPERDPLYYMTYYMGLEIEREVKGILEELL